MRSQYFELFKHTIKRIDSALCMGSPTISTFVPGARFDGEREDMNCHFTHQTKDMRSPPWHGVWIEVCPECCHHHSLLVAFALDTADHISECSYSIEALAKS